MPAISVIMSTYNEPIKVLNEAIESILTQTFTDFEFIIVIDNPENIQTVDYLENKAEFDNRISIFKNEENLGLANSLNRAIEYSNGEYVCRMDADDVSLPNRIELQLKKLIQEDCDLIGGRMSVMDEDGRHIYDTPKLPETWSEINEALKWNNCVPHATWFGKKSVFKKCYRQVALSEDYDFLIRTALDGQRICNCREIVLRYRMSQQSISRSNLYKQYLYQQGLSSSYKKGRVANVDALDSEVDKKFNDQKAIKYARANVIFNESLNYMHNGKRLKALSTAARIPFVSEAYLFKIIRMAVAAFF